MRTHRLYNWRHMSANAFRGDSDLRAKSYYDAHTLRGWTSDHTSLPDTRSLTSPVLEFWPSPISARFCQVYRLGARRKRSAGQTPSGVMCRRITPWG